MSTKTSKEIISQLEQVLEIECTPALNGKEAQALHKELPGYRTMMDDAIEFFQKEEETLRLTEISPDKLQQSFDTLQQLLPAEKALQELSKSVYHQRLVATSECMDGLLKISRRVAELQNAYPELAEKGAFFKEFLQNFRRKAGKKSDSSTETPAK